MDAEGLWFDFPQSEEGEVINASIFDCHGRRLAGHSFVILRDRERCRWNVDHTAWPQGPYVLEVKGERVLRQKMLKK